MPTQRHSRKLVTEFGDRCVWGLDWPHPNHAGPIPDDGELVDLLEQIATAKSRRQALLVDNPQRLYRFAPVRRRETEAKA
jgi:2-pyrone-4,6-dicarboxylate lactonase